MSIVSLNPFWIALVAACAFATTAVAVDRHPTNQVGCPTCCQETLTPVPPSYVNSMTVGDLEHSPAVASPGGIFHPRAQVLPRESLVRPLYPGLRADLIPVEVIRRAPASERKSRGYVWYQALKEASDPDYLLTSQDTLLMLMGDLLESPLARGSGLTPSMQAGQYRVLSCAGPLSGHSKERLTVYLYRIRSAESSNMKNTNRAPASCLPILSVGHAPSTDWEINEWGRVRLPMAHAADLPTGIVAISADRNYVQYGKNEIGLDSWADPHAACAWTQLAEKWQRECPAADRKRCTPQIGDAGFLVPGKRIGKLRDPLGHQFHHRGRCFDMRPFRKDGNWQALDIRTNRAAYDAQLTGAFIDFLNRNGASPIYFNDVKTVRRYGNGPARDLCNLKEEYADIGRGVLRCDGHDNHLHFCLEPEKTQGCDRFNF